MEARWLRALSGHEFDTNERSPCLLLAMRKPAAGMPLYSTVNANRSPAAKARGSVTRTRSRSCAKRSGPDALVTEETVMPFPPEGAGRPARAGGSAHGSPSPAGVFAGLGAAVN